MKGMILAAALALGLSACTTGDRYNAVASTCQTYAVALNTAAALNRSGKLSAATVAKIDATTGPAKAVCSGTAPTNDPAAVQKVADLVIVVLQAQGEEK
jgi:uncharacterized lipoprotein